MDLIVVFCILFVFMLVLYRFCVATEFSVNKDLYFRNDDFFGIGGRKAGGTNVPAFLRGDCHVRQSASDVCAWSL